MLGCPQEGSGSDLVSPPSTSADANAESIVTAATTAPASGAGAETDQETDDEGRRMVSTGRANPMAAEGEGEEGREKDEVDTAYDTIMVQIKKQVTVYLKKHEDEPEVLHDEVMTMGSTYFIIFLYGTTKLCFHPPPPHSPTQERVLDGVYREHHRRIVARARERKKKGAGALTLGDLTQKCDEELFPDTLRFKSSLYLWIIVLMGVFYTLPVAQLLIGNQVSRSGQQLSANLGSYF